MKIKGRTLIFKNPKKADVLIFDEVNSSYVMKIINKKYLVSVFKTRPEDIYLGQKVLIIFFKSILSLNFSEAWNSNRGKLIGFLRQLKLLYLESCFLTINPKAIVTLIDNDSNFHWFSKYCRKFPFVAIQNGSRLSFMSSEIQEFHLQHYFCFGEHERNLFQNIGYKVENFYPVGSVIASMHIAEPNDILLKYDILVVSTWRGNIGFTQDVKDTMRSMKIMDELLALYISKKKYKLAIITRAERNGEHWFIPELGSNEEDYFKNIYGNNIEIIETDFKTRNIYPLMQQSRFIISCLSTALLEGFGIGKKVLYCNFTGRDIYHKDFDRSIVCKDQNNFATTLDMIIDMPELEYNRQFNSLAKYYMQFPDDKLTHEAITEKIDQIIEKK